MQEKRIVRKGRCWREGGQRERREKKEAMGGAGRSKKG